MTPLDPETLTYDANGLIVCVAQDAATGTVLIVAYATREAVAQTIETNEAHFWSRSRNELWRKGETSGNVLHVESIQADCDGDALIMSVHASGPACHTGKRSCFASPAILTDQLDATLADRRDRRPSGSYCAELFTQGRQAILRKVGEEAVEVLLAGANEGDIQLVHEVADLWFHTAVLLADRGLGTDAVLRELADRHKPRMR